MALKLINLDKIQNENENTMVGVDGDADELLDEVVGSVQQRKRNVLTRTGKMRKESRLNSVKLVKRKKQISYKLEYNNFML